MEHNTTNVDEILNQRGTVYGSYEDGVKCRADIVNALEYVYKLNINSLGMPKELQIMFGDLALKLMRAASNPSHIDSWVDLEGYAKLIKEEMETKYATKS